MPEDHTDPSRPRLAFGLNPLPPGVETAYGARWVIAAWLDHTYDVYQVGDRTDTIGPDGRAQTLVDYLNEHVGSQDRTLAKDLLDTGDLGWSENRDVVLFEDDTVVVRGNPRRSKGYLYVHAYFKDDEASPSS